MGTLATTLGIFVPWLLKTTLQGSLLICLILLIKAVLRDRLSARWHHGLWLVLLVRLILPWAPSSRLSIYGPVLSPFSSHYPTSGWAGPSTDETRLTWGSPDRAGGLRQAPARAPMGTAPQTSSEPARSVAEDVSSRIAVSSHDESPQAGRRGRSAASLVIPALTWVWLVGGTLLMGYILLRAFRLWRAVTKERPVTDQGILEALEDGKMRMRVRTLVGVVVTDMVRTPALFGFIRPRILLPQGLIETLGPDGLHHVFLHELAHLKRRDIHLAWLVCLLQVLHWFNPLIWFAFRRMRTDQEMAADALALAAAGAGESRRYGQTIVSLLERFSCPQYLPSLAGILENPSHIERRIQMIARFNTTRRRPLLAVAPLVVLALIALTDAQDKPKSDKPQAVTPPAASAAPAEKVSVADVNGTLVDPNTGLKFTVAKKISGENDVIIHNNTVSLSPNGKFLRWRGTAIPLDGGRPISLGGGGRDVAWSPDGKLIAYRSGWEIWLLPVSPETCQATGPARKLADDEANWSVGRISWSADSECLMLYYFEEGKRRPTEKCLSARDGKLIQTPDYTRFGLASPDQKRLAYFKGRGVWTASP